MESKFKWRWLVVGLVAVWVGSWFVGGAGEVKDALESSGHTDVTVTRKGLFNYGFTASKGDMDCSGNVARYPGSSSTRSFCGSARKPERKLEDVFQEGIEKLLRRDKDLAFTRVRCEPVEEDAVTATCHVETEGSGVDVTVEDKDGQWKVTSPAFFQDLGKLATQLEVQLVALGSADTQVECGTGLIGVGVTTTHICKMTPPNKPTVDLAVGFDAEGLFTFTLDP